VSPWRSTCQLWIGALGGTTVTSVFPVPREFRALISLLPGCRAVIVPLEDTLATAAALLDQLSAPPALKAAVGATVAEFPGSRNKVAGTSATL
jgi:hypothetical protein